MMSKINEIEGEYTKEKLPEFAVGDTVDVDVTIVEAGKTRVQTFQGTVIARSGSGIRETFTVRRIVQGEGVERVFPVHSPAVADVRVVRRGRVRRAKLHYLRQRVGKATRVRQKLPTGRKKKAGETADNESGNSKD
jgi:large subunit ribosomal protein L19